MSSPNENSSQVRVKPHGRLDQRQLIFFCQQQARVLSGWHSTQTPSHSWDKEESPGPILVCVSGLNPCPGSAKPPKDLSVPFHPHRAQRVQWQETRPACNTGSSAGDPGSVQWGILPGKKPGEKWGDRTGKGSEQWELLSLPELGKSQLCNSRDASWMSWISQRAVGSCLWAAPGPPQSSGLHFSGSMSKHID